MAENTKIQWADYTFNPWLVRGDTRRRAAESTWRRVDRWNRLGAAREEQPM